MEERVEYVPHLLAIPDVDGAIVRIRQSGVRASVNVSGQESRGQIPSPPNAREVGGPAGVRIRGVGTAAPISCGPKPICSILQDAMLPVLPLHGQLSRVHQKCGACPSLVLCSFLEVGPRHS